MEKSKDGQTMIYSGGEEHKKGVGIIIRNSIAKLIVGYWAISERVIVMKLQSKPFDINIIQIYAPTQDYDEEDIEKFYEVVQLAIKTPNLVIYCT